MLFVDLFIQDEDKWVTVGSSGGKETVREYSDYVKKVPFHFDNRLIIVYY